MSGPDKERTIEQVTGGKLLALLPLAFLARLWAATLRFEVSDDARGLLADDRKQVFLLWHNRLFVIAEIYRRFRRPHCRSRRMHGLISASKDGAWLAAFFQLVGIWPIRGSSSWRATESLREVLRVIDADADVGITPDGPRGPCYSFQPGAVLVARKASVPVAVLGIHFSRARRLDSWDGFYIPMPFSTIRLQGMQLESLRELKAGSDRDSQAEGLCRILERINPDNIPHPREKADG